MNTIILYAPPNRELRFFVSRIPENMDKKYTNEFGVEFIHIHYGKALCKIWFYEESQKSFEEDMNDPPGEIEDIIQEVKRLGVTKMFGLDYRLDRHCFDIMKIILNDEFIYIDTSAHGLVRGDRYVLEIEKFIQTTLSSL